MMGLNDICVLLQSQLQACESKEEPRLQRDRRLTDPAGYTYVARPFDLSLRPAPVQLIWAAIPARVLHPSAPAPFSHSSGPTTCTFKRITYLVHRPAHLTSRLP